MSCYHPIAAVREKSGGVTIVSGRALALYPDGVTLRLPCGTCIGCQKARAREWSLRCKLESARHRRVCWGTLTYSDKYVPPTLSKRHISLFMKRLRKCLGKRRVRFFLSGEYGELTFCPHYHPIFFGISVDELALVQRCWTFGHVKLFPISDNAIAYVAGYVAKKLGHKLDPEERVNRDTGEVYQFQPPFVLMSRRPGIGGHARKFVSDWRSHAVYNGRPVPVPRFLHSAWRKQASDAELEALDCEMWERSSKRDTSSPALEAAEYIAQVRQLHVSLRRRTV